jgi:asparagine synthase (glutamine-hydrolysing)
VPDVVEDVQARAGDSRRERPGPVGGRQRVDRSDDYLGRMIAADVAVTLPDDYLVKVDRASMAWGLEVRPPLLDHELLEMCAVIPSKFKIRQGQTKWILKQSFRQRLPASLLVRRKQGFELPLDKWLRFSLRDMFEAEVLSPGSAIADLIDRRVAQRLYEAHLYGAQRNGPTLWSLLVLAIWARRYLKTPATCAA